MMPALPTPEEALKALKAQPGIDLTRQRKGTKIMVETDNHLFEITVLNPASGLVEVSSTLPLLRESTVGQYLRGVYALDANVGLDAWIGRTLQMFIRFRNGNLMSAPVIAASVIGPGWTYDVF
jgi:hypothetical protein